MCNCAKLKAWICNGCRYVGKSLKTAEETRESSRIEYVLQTRAWLLHCALLIYNVVHLALETSYIDYLGQAGGGSELWIEHFYTAWIVIVALGCINAIACAKWRLLASIIFPLETAKLFILNTLATADECHELMQGTIVLCALTAALSFICDFRVGATLMLVGTVSQVVIVEVTREASGPKPSTESNLLLQLLLIVTSALAIVLVSVLAFYITELNRRLSNENDESLSLLNRMYEGVIVLVKNSSTQRDIKFFNKAASKIFNQSDSPDSASFKRLETDDLMKPKFVATKLIEHNLIQESVLYSNSSK